MLPAALPEGELGSRGRVFKKDVISDIEPLAGAEPVNANLAIDCIRLEHQRRVASTDHDPRLGSAVRVLQAAGFAPHGERRTALAVFGSVWGGAFALQSEPSSSALNVSQESALTRAHMVDPTRSLTGPILWKNPVSRWRRRYGSRGLGPAA